MSTNELLKLYQDMFSEYGDPVNYWPQWCAKDKPAIEREKVIIGMILVQRTTWHNANIALKQLRDANLLSTANIAKLKNLKELKELLRPAGFYQSKPSRLFDICSFIENCGGVGELLLKDVYGMRQELLKIKGVGKETADTILLYALDKPVFIIDEYTYRWADKNHIPHTRKYDLLQNFFHKNLKPNLEIYRNFHTLIIVSERGKKKSGMEIV